MPVALLLIERKPGDLLHSTTRETETSYAAFTTPREAQCATASVDTQTRQLIDTSEPAIN
jgi:hypothetical protein